MGGRDGWDSKKENNWRKWSKDESNFKRGKVYQINAMLVAKMKTAQQRPTNLS